MLCKAYILQCCLDDVDLSSVLSALVPSQPGEKAVHYPARPVDTTTDFEGTTSVQPQQVFQQTQSLVAILRD